MAADQAVQAQADVINAVRDAELEPHVYLLPGQAGSGMLAMSAAAVETGEPLVLTDFAYPNEILQAERRYDIRAVKVGDGLTLAWSDVTERYESARERAESRAKFRLLAENASDLVAMASTDGTRLWFSESIRNYGWSPEDLVGRSALEFLHPDDVPKLQQVSQAIAAGQESVIEWRISEQDAPSVWHWFRVHFTAVTGGVASVAA